MSNSHTNLIGEEVVVVDEDDVTKVIARGEIVAFTPGDSGSNYTFYIALRNSEQKGMIQGISDWSNLRLAKYWGNV